METSRFQFGDKDAQMKYRNNNVLVQNSILYPKNSLFIRFVKKMTFVTRKFFLIFRTNRLKPFYSYQGKNRKLTKKLQKMVRMTHSLWHCNNQILALFLHTMKTKKAVGSFRCEADTPIFLASLLETFNHVDCFSDHTTNTREHWKEHKFLFISREPPRLSQKVFWHRLSNKHRHTILSSAKNFETTNLHLFTFPFTAAYLLQLNGL